MRQNELKDATYKLLPQHYENIFNIYEVADNNGDLKYWFNILRKVDFPEDLDQSVYSTYTTVLNDTWPLISWKHYNNVVLWWIICAVNKIDNPTIQPKPGTELKILDINVVRNVLNSLKD